jgi:hypothetical protein
MARSGWYDKAEFPSAKILGFHAIEAGEDSNHD